MSVDWMRALAEALSVHFPQFKHEPYFQECFSHMVEERHAAETIEVTQMLLRIRPGLLAETLHEAKTIAAALDGMFDPLDRLALSSSAKISPFWRSTKTRSFSASRWDRLSAGKPSRLAASRQT
jgi:hypothetical protein